MLLQGDNLSSEVVTLGVDVLLNDLVDAILLPELVGLLEVLAHRGHELLVILTRFPVVLVHGKSGPKVLVEVLVLGVAHVFDKLVEHSIVDFILDRVRKDALLDILDKIVTSEHLEAVGLKDSGGVLLVDLLLGAHLFAVKICVPAWLAHEVSPEAAVACASLVVEAESPRKAHGEHVQLDLKGVSLNILHHDLDGVGLGPEVIEPLAHLVLDNRELAIGVAVSEERLAKFLGFAAGLLKLVTLITAEVLKSLAPHEESLVIGAHALLELMTNVDAHGAAVEAGVKLG